MDVSGTWLLRRPQQACLESKHRVPRFPAVTNISFPNTTFYQITFLKHNSKHVVSKMSSNKKCRYNMFHAFAENISPNETTKDNTFLEKIPKERFPCRRFPN